jgi:hypothetical protein
VSSRDLPAVVRLSRRSLQVGGIVLAQCSGRLYILADGADGSRETLCIWELGDGREWAPALARDRKGRMVAT